MVSVAYKNRTREEIIAAFRESIRRKHEWQKRAEEEIKKIRQERLQLSLWTMNPLDLTRINRLAPSNPRLDEILAEFNETISILTNKPQ